MNLNQSISLSPFLLRLYAFFEPKLLFFFYLLTSCVSPSDKIIGLNKVIAAATTASACIRKGKKKKNKKSAPTG